MQKIKVPMRCTLKQAAHMIESVSNPAYDNQLEITLIPEPFTQSFRVPSKHHTASADYLTLTFNKYIAHSLKVDIRNLYIIRDLLTSTRVENAFDMITLVKQLVPMLDEAIQQAYPDNYQLEIIK